MSLALLHKPLSTHVWLEKTAQLQVEGVWGKVKELFERVEMGERTTRPGWGKRGAEDHVPREAKEWNDETQTGDTDHRSWVSLSRADENKADAYVIHVL